MASAIASSCARIVRFGSLQLLTHLGKLALAGLEDGMTGTNVTRETPGGHRRVAAIAAQEPIHGGMRFLESIELKTLLFEIVKGVGDHIQDGLVDWPQRLGERA